MPRTKYGNQLGAIVKDAGDVTKTVAILSDDTTVMALQLNSEPDSVDVKPVEIKTEKQAYETFQPQIEIDLKKLDGEEESGVIKYNSLKDFDKNEIIDRTPLLNELDSQKELYGNFSDILSNDERLRTVLSNPEQKKELLELINLIIEELDNSNKN